MQWQQLLNSERPRPSTSPVDHRIDFEKDYDRSIFSTPVKRLQDKAQVFPLDPCDAVRTRLTHSMEVSCTARGLGIAVGKWLVKEEIITAEDSRAIEAILATCGLIHDLGNPPFGHSGEDAIQYWFETRFPGDKLGKQLENSPQLINDFRKFEGNAQSLRLVGKLQVLADAHGLNLTYGTLSASCKYTAPSDKANSEAEDYSKRKPGYFASEGSLVDKIREKTGSGDARNPLTFLVEAADDIVYSVADVEDGIKKGILKWAELEKLLKEYVDGSCQELGQVFGRKESILRAGRFEVPSGLAEDVHGAAFRTAAIGVLVESATKNFQDRYQSIMKGEYKEDLLTRNGQLHPLINALKKIGKERIYCTPENLKLEVMGRDVICDLMDKFWEGAEKFPAKGRPKTKSFAGKLGALLSSNYAQVFQQSLEEGELPETYRRFQLVTDYVCGMTDSFAKRLHAELLNGI
ncbi:dGTP triphosphohydrolase [Blastopirellula marina]|uniref:Deoxyguanosinetriphosphate triphosphohydrolase n=1 Tax=Blastopirellula marina TaxID=124 RepID=A0A2S8GDN0_9BACT|nr:dNTP triphosphohydrolase [Blastopirellula marina]PQO42565.1 deoxyguanosinetriphosphate triphosphohydrolase [Blastopirellula marina]PTL46331.1 HD domain-containing protein [Blastopirellula marina]